MPKVKRTRTVKRGPRKVKKKRAVRYPVGLEGLKKATPKRKVKKLKGKRLSQSKLKSGAKRKIVMCLGSVPKAGVPEIKVRYNKSSKRFLGTITQSKDAADFIRKLYTRGSIELQEYFIVLYLNRRNEIIGYYKHAIGAISGVVADTRIILGTALKSLATSIMIAHNHPSGNTRYSEADRDLTKKIAQAGKLMDITLLDHIIVTKKEYFSFADEGLI